MLRSAKSEGTPLLKGWPSRGRLGVASSVSRARIVFASSNHLRRAILVLPEEPRTEETRTATGCSPVLVESGRGNES